MIEIKNRFCVTMRDGERREFTAGRVDVGKAGELQIKDVNWTFWNTFESVREVIAPGTWAEWVRFASQKPLQTQDQSDKGWMRG